MFRSEAKELLTPEILNLAVRQFAISPESVELIGGFENIIYQGSREGQQVVLRVTHHRHRSRELLASELHWLEYLRDNQADVCGPHPSLAGNLVETIPCRDTFLHFSCFAKAPGRHIVTREELDNIQLFQAWGRATGKIHRLTRNYSSPRQLPRRGDNIDLFYQTLAHCLPQEGDLRAKADQVAAFIRSLPRTPDWYGLMHSDIHPANFCYDGSRLYIFDFDDACFYQLASDGAMALYYSIWGCRLEGEARDEFGHRFISNWLRGYLQEHPFSLEQLKTFPQLLLFRDCELLALLREELDLENLAPDQDALLQQMTSRILAGRPWVTIDYERVWQEVTK